MSSPPGNSHEARQLTVEQLLAQAIRILERSRAMPFSTSVMINGDELTAILQRASAALPEELRAARWMLKEREDMRAVNLRVRRKVDRAEARAKRSARETEDWAYQGVEALEETLQKTVTSVAAGRQRLQDRRMPRPEPAPEPAKKEDDVFDQDLGGLSAGNNGT